MTVDGDGQPLSDVSRVAFRTDDPTGAMLDDLFAHPGAISAVDGSYLSRTSTRGPTLFSARDRRRQ